MRGKGLSMDVIVEAAFALVQEKGYGNYSVRELAQSLHVKAASLYNHIDGIDDINRKIGCYAGNLMNATLRQAIQGKSRDEALIALACAYRDFVRDNYELYRSIIGLPVLDEDGSISEVGRDSIRVIREAIAQYGTSREDAIRFSRCLRGALHGFVLLEKAGYYTGGSVDREDSFQFMVKGYIDWINRLPKKQAAE